MRVTKDTKEKDMTCTKTSKNRLESDEIVWRNEKNRAAKMHVTMPQGGAEFARAGIFYRTQAFLRGYFRFRFIDVQGFGCLSRVFPVVFFLLSSVMW